MVTIRGRLFGLILAALAWPVIAQESGGSLYSAEAPVASQAEDDAGPALRAALARVLVRLTGLPDALHGPGVAEALERAPELVLATRYRQGFEGEGGERIYRDFLIADFDPVRVDGLLAELGLVVWPLPRPTPMLWLAIDDGRGPRLVNAAQGAAVEALRAAGFARGIRFALPEGSPEDDNFGVQAAWRDDLEAADALLARSPGGAQLLGRLYRVDGGWRAEWVLREHGVELARWSESGLDARSLLAAAGAGTADRLARRFAELAAAGPSGRFVVRVHGLRSADHYPRLIGYLRGLGPVRQVTPVAAEGDALIVELDLAVGLQGFAHLVETGPVLRADDSQSPPAEFRMLE